MEIYEYFSSHLAHTIPITVAFVGSLIYINSATAWAILIFQDLFDKTENKNFKGEFMPLGTFSDFDLIIKTLDEARNKFLKPESTSEKMPDLKTHPCLYITNAKLSDVEKFRGKKGWINRSGHQLSSKRRNKNKGYQDWDIYRDFGGFRDLDSTKELGFSIGSTPEMEEIIELTAEIFRNAKVKLYWIYLEIEGGIIRIPLPDFSDCK